MAAECYQWWDILGGKSPDFAPGQCSFFGGKPALSEALGWVIVVVRATTHLGPRQLARPGSRPAPLCSARRAALPAARACPRPCRLAPSYCAARALLSLAAPRSRPLPARRPAPGHAPQAFGALFTMMTSVLVFLDYRFGGTTTSSEQVRTARMTHACTHCDAPPLTARPHAAAALCTSADALARLRGTRCSLPPRATPPLTPSSPPRAAPSRPASPPVTSCPSGPGRPRCSRCAPACVQATTKV